MSVTIEALQAEADRFCARVMEFGADAVQVLITKSEGSQCKSAVTGRGNWYARIGLCLEFMERDRAMTEQQAVHEAHEGEEGEPA